MRALRTTRHWASIQRTHPHRVFGTDKHTPKDIAPEKEEHHRETEEATPIKDVKEIGGPSGKEPTRFGDWEKNGRCFDF